VLARKLTDAEVTLLQQECKEAYEQKLRWWAQQVLKMPRKKDQLAALAEVAREPEPKS